MILITGGLGFFGTGMARYLLEQGKEVLLTRRRTSRIPLSLSDHLDKKLRVVDCDILDFPNLLAILKKYRVESIIHAAMVTLAKATLYQEVMTNLEGTVHVLEAARLTDIKRVSFTSSGTVYHGIRSEIPYKETMPLSLDVQYHIGSNKIAAEALCNLYAEQDGLDLIIARISMGYGPGSASAGFGPVEVMVEGAVKGKRVVLPQVHPEAKRDFIYIDDCARAMGMLHLAKELKYKVYNVASGRTHTFGEVAAVVKKLIPDCHIELKGERASWHPPGLDISRLHDELDFEPKYDLEHGIQEYIHWIVKGKP